jgi:6-phosphogluconolactonase
MHTIHRSPDLEALSHAAARTLVDDVRAVLDTQDRYTLALAGGRTPRRCYELLASGAEGTLPWDRIHLFWGDERYVPLRDERSTAHLARTALIDAIAIPEDNVHPVPTHLTSPTAAAAAYADTLRQCFPDRRRTFDAVLLGLGDDGHTASLFPETRDLDDTDDWVRGVEAPPRYGVTTRLTCTLPVINGARRAIVLVAGAGKRAALRAVLDDRDPSLPGTHIRPRRQADWFVDHAARPVVEGGAASKRGRL